MLTRLTLTVAAGALVAAVAGAAMAQDKAPAMPTPQDHFAQMQKAQQAAWAAYQKELQAYYAKRQELMKTLAATQPGFGPGYGPGYGYGPAYGYARPQPMTREQMEAQRDAMKALNELDAEFMAKQSGMPAMKDMRARQDARMAAFAKESDARGAAQKAETDAFAKESEARAKQMREWSEKQNEYMSRMYGMPTPAQMRAQQEQMRAWHMKRMEQMRAAHAPKSES